MSSSDVRAGIPTREVISLLWIVGMFSVGCADILDFITPGSLQQIMTGYVDQTEITPDLLLIFTILLEIPIAMIFLSRVLKNPLNRIHNIAASITTLAFVIGGGSATLVRFCRLYGHGPKLSHRVALH